MDNMIDLSLPLEEIIKAKAAFDKAQADRFMADYKSAIALLSGRLNDSEPNHKVATQTNLLTDINEAYMPVVSQDIVKPLVIQYLSSHPGKHVTTEIFEYIKSVRALTITTKDERRVWVTAISLALNTLSGGSNPKVHKTDTDNGNIKAYEWIAA